MTRFGPPILFGLFAAAAVGAATFWVVGMGLFLGFVVAVGSLIVRVIESRRAR